MGEYEPRRQAAACLIRTMQTPGSRKCDGSTVDDNNAVAWQLDARGCEHHARGAGWTGYWDRRYHQYWCSLARHSVALAGFSRPVTEGGWVGRVLRARLG